MTVAYWIDQQMIGPDDVVVCRPSYAHPMDGEEEVVTLIIPRGSPEELANSLGEFAARAVQFRGVPISVDVWHRVWNKRGVFYQLEVNAAGEEGPLS